jgi:ribose transport system ATP-binding protein
VCSSDLVYLKGEEVHFKGPSDAQKLGVGFVHQELALCPHVTVAQNIFMGRLPVKNGVVDTAVLNENSEKILEPFHVDIKSSDKLGDLSVAQQQIVEIARALSLNCKVVIFDEPTSSLNEAEAEALFRVINDISKKGISVLYISHKLSEIFEICNTITVMRDGSVIETMAISETSPEQIVTSMVGKELGHLYPEKSKVMSEEILLGVKGFTRYPDFKNITFELKKGEILGLSGLVGSGRTELSRAICGIDGFEEGTVYINGIKTKIESYEDAIKNGLCYLTEDRKKDGLFLNMSIKDNVAACIIDSIANHSILSDKLTSDIALDYKKKLNIKITDVMQKVNSLSGGNQQKVLIAKLLATQPKIIIMDEPTRGIDVGAKSEIHSMLRSLCDAGIGIIMISSELPEIVGVCDRVLVMHEGQILGELSKDEITQDNIIQKTSQFSALKGA